MVMMMMNARADGIAALLRDCALLRPVWNLRGWRLGMMMKVAVTARMMAWRISGFEASAPGSHACLFAAISPSGAVPLPIAVAAAPSILATAMRKACHATNCLDSALNGLARLAAAGGHELGMLAAFLPVLPSWGTRVVDVLSPFEMAKFGVSGRPC